MKLSHYIQLHDVSLLHGKIQEVKFLEVFKGRSFIYYKGELRLDPWQKEVKNVWSENPANYHVIEDCFYSYDRKRFQNLEDAIDAAKIDGYAEFDTYPTDPILPDTLTSTIDRSFKAYNPYAVKAKKALDSYIEKIEASKKLYIRFGELPKNGRSYNSADNFYETGVSVMSGRLYDGHVYIMGTSQGEGTFLFSLQDRKTYIVEGDLVGTGSDGEPLLANVKIISECKVSYVDYDNIDIDIDQSPTPPAKA